jgi:ribonucleotide monophosphatase NagD (HAD superfamily)
MTTKEILEEYGITSIYHFTDNANIQTIEKYGLQSLKNICDLDIDVKHFGAEELSHILDERRGLDKYVHLSFIKDHPMYHIAKSRGNLINPVWIELDSSILYENTTLFCDKVANQNGAKIFDIDSILENINFEILTDNRFLSGEDWQKRKETRKAEIMALDSISTNKIKGITYGK